MPNPMKTLEKIGGDRFQYYGLIVPSAVIAGILLIYKDEIHSSLYKIPEPFSKSIFGNLIFVLLTLAVTLILKRLAHDILNPAYDMLYRNRKLRDPNAYQNQARNIPLWEVGKNNYKRYRDKLEQLEDPSVAESTALEIQGKLARSLVLIFFLFALFFIYIENYGLAVVLFLGAAFMLYSFFRYRWDASENIYRAACERYKSNKL